MYHEIELPGRPLCQSAAGYLRYILPLETFRSQMAWMKESGWRGLSRRRSASLSRRAERLHHL